jgi:hypothetical protein
MSIKAMNLTATCAAAGYRYRVRQLADLSRLFETAQRS